jgi:hypothetical protein
MKKAHKKKAAKKVVAKKKKVAKRSRVRRSAVRKSSKGATMARRKRARKTGAKRHSRSMKHIMVLDGGMEGRRTHKRSRRRSSAALMGFDTKALTGNAVQALLAVGGGLAGLYAGKMIPASVNPKIKAALPLLAGIGLTGFMKNRMLQSLGMGLAVVGGLALAQKMIPGLPGMSGDGATEDEIRAMLGGAGAPMGEIEDFSGDVSVMGEDEIMGAEDFDGDDLDGDDLDGDVSVMGAGAPMGGYTD